MRSSFLVSFDWTTFSFFSLCFFAEADSVTLSCCCPLASVVVCDEPVTCAAATIEDASKTATATPASALALKLGKKERSLILLCTP